jgi:2-polyprenyl-6-methoxyphenol hydroxylase-like FAD-dependent oxidoreductase
VPKRSFFDRAIAFPTRQSKTIHDVIIIGGGPAGATAAAFIASQGHKVLVLEKARFPREKLCGEFISPECVTIFERLGVDRAIRDAGARVIRRMDLIVPDGRRIEIPVSWFSGEPRGHSD